MLELEYILNLRLVNRNVRIKVSGCIGQVTFEKEGSPRSPRKSAIIATIKSWFGINELSEQHVVITAGDPIFQQTDDLVRQFPHDEGRQFWTTFNLFNPGAVPVSLEMGTGKIAMTPINPAGTSDHLAKVIAEFFWSTMGGQLSE